MSSVTGLSTKSLFENQDSAGPKAISDQDAFISEIVSRVMPGEDDLFPVDLLESTDNPSPVDPPESAGDFDSAAILELEGLLPPECWEIIDEGLLHDSEKGSSTENFSLSSKANPTKSELRFWTKVKSQKFASIYLREKDFSTTVDQFNKLNNTCIPVCTCRAFFFRAMKNPEKYGIKDVAEQLNELYNSTKRGTLHQWTIKQLRELAAIYIEEKNLTIAVNKFNALNNTSLTFRSCETILCRAKNDPEKYGIKDVAEQLNELYNSTKRGTLHRWTIKQLRELAVIYIEEKNLTIAVNKFNALNNTSLTLRSCETILYRAKNDPVRYSIKDLSEKLKEIYRPTKKSKTYQWTNEKVKELAGFYIKEKKFSDAIKKFNKSHGLKLTRQQCLTILLKAMKNPETFDDVEIQDLSEKLKETYKPTKKPISHCWTNDQVKELAGFYIKEKKFTKAIEKFNKSHGLELTKQQCRIILHKAMENPEKYGIQDISEKLKEIYKPTKKPNPDCWTNDQVKELAAIYIKEKNFTKAIEKYNKSHGLELTKQRCNRILLKAMENPKKYGIQDISEKLKEIYKPTKKSKTYQWTNEKVKELAGFYIEEENFTKAIEKFNKSHGLELVKQQCRIILLKAMKNPKRYGIQDLSEKLKEIYKPTKKIKKTVRV